jgi:hypothetical protein
MRRITCTGDRDSWCSFCRGQLGGRAQERDAITGREALKEGDS